MKNLVNWTSYFLEKILTRHILNKYSFITPQAKREERQLFQSDQNTYTCLGCILLLIHPSWKRFRPDVDKMAIPKSTP